MSEKAGPTPFRAGHALKVFLYPRGMDIKGFIRLVEGVAEVNAGSLRFDSRLEDFGWDSLCVIGLISELDRLKLDSVSVDSIVQAETIQDLHTDIFGP